MRMNYAEALPGGHLRELEVYAQRDAQFPLAVAEPWLRP